MLVLCTLCVLLLLASVNAEHKCDETISTGFLAKPQLQGSLEDNFCYKSWYLVASAAKRSYSNVSSVEITFNCTDSVIVNYVFRDSIGNPALPPTSHTFTLDGDHIKQDGTVNQYSFVCDKLLVFYGCATEHDQDSTPDYYFWSPMEYTEDQVIDARTSCEEQVVEIDTNAKFVERHYPRKPPGV